MSVSGNETEKNDRLNTALVAFTGCIGEALDGICSYGLTVGETYVPFRPDPEDDCEDEDEMCSQVWVRVTGITPMSTPDSFGGDSCATELRIGLEVGVLRCFGIEEEGEAPYAMDTMSAALQAMDDMRDIQCAALGCEVWEAIDVGQWVPYGPSGGQYGGIWTFTVEV